MSPSKPGVAYVIPCHNEATRLSVDHITAYLGDHPLPEIILVDDGSTDDTQAIISHLQRRFPERIKTIHLQRNCGKGEAVRTGLNAALQAGAGIVGYLDADFSAPLPIMDHLRGHLQEKSIHYVLGSRVKMLGYRIERRALRHFLGRVFATLASLALGLPAYDTQCGAKLFRVTPALIDALALPFSTRWTFDLELMQRLLAHGSGGGLTSFKEVPLPEWKHKGGSKLGLRQMIGAFHELLKLAMKSRQRWVQP